MALSSLLYPCCHSPSGQEERQNLSPDYLSDTIDLSRSESHEITTGLLTRRRDGGVRLAQHPR